MDVPVYIVSGFLDSGKTTFIQGLMEDEEFNAGEKTLLLLCEEGEIEYDKSRFSFDNVAIKTIENEEDITTEYLQQLYDEAGAERVVLEYNGMWNLPKFYEAMPMEWMIYQEVTFVHAPTFLNYNTNMRQLVFDKLQNAEMIIFNRCERGSFSKEEFHKIVRVANRRGQIIFEYAEDDVEFDDIKDPLPYDMSAENIKIEDDWYAEWYRDINDEEESYDGLTFTIKGRVLKDEKGDPRTFVFGRHLMTCCVEDIQFAGLVGVWDIEAPQFNTGEWMVLTFTVKLEFHELYSGDGPVLHCNAAKKAQPADPEVAQF